MKRLNERGEWVEDQSGPMYGPSISFDGPPPDRTQQLPERPPMNQPNTPPPAATIAPVRPPELQPRSPSTLNPNGPSLAALDKFGIRYVLPTQTPPGATAPTAQSPAPGVLPPKPANAMQALEQRKAELARIAGNNALMGATRQDARAELARTDEALRLERSDMNRRADIAAVTKRENDRAQAQVKAAETRGAASMAVAERNAASRKEVAELTANWRREQAQSMAALAGRKLDMAQVQAMKDNERKDLDLSIKQRLADSTLSGKWKGELPPVGHQLTLDDGGTATFLGQVGSNGAPIYKMPTPEDPIKQYTREQLEKQRTASTPTPTPTAQAPAATPAPAAKPTTPAATAQNRVAIGRRLRQDGKYEYRGADGSTWTD